MDVGHGADRERRDRGVHVVSSQVRLLQGWLASVTPAHLDVPPPLPLDQFPGLLHHARAVIDSNHSALRANGCPQRPEVLTGAAPDVEHRFPAVQVKVLEDERPDRALPPLGPTTA